jgi:hypothetical protein
VLAVAEHGPERARRPGFCNSRRVSRSRNSERWGRFRAARNARCGGWRRESYVRKGADAGQGHAPAEGEGAATSDKIARARMKSVAFRRLSKVGVIARLLAGNIFMAFRVARLLRPRAACSPGACRGDVGVVLERQSAVPRDILKCRASRRGMTAGFRPLRQVAQNDLTKRSRSPGQSGQGAASPAEDGVPEIGRRYSADRPSPRLIVCGSGARPRR